MAAAPVVIAPIDNCLPNFIESGKVVDWKRKLFYMLGYCDTYHDFHASRLKDGNKSDEKAALIRAVKSVGSLSEYIKKVIGRMDEEFGWEMNVYKPIDDFITTKNKYSFENAMFAAFTKTIASPLPVEGGAEVINKNTLAEKMDPDGEKYMKYLHESLKIKQTQTLDIQILTMKHFQDGVPEALSSIIELEMPAVLTKRDDISKNLQAFLHKCYSNNIKDGRIQFVEDTASFPRSIFDGFPAQRDAFMKIVTTQTQWDPAGVSDYYSMDSTEKAEKIIAAPSFIAKQKFNDAGSYKFDESIAYFTDKSIIITGNNPVSQPLTNKSGPSVNHLLLHMILNTPTVSLEQTESDLLKNVLRAASLSAAKSKNITFIVDEGGNDNDKDQKLRNYTSSKRSGDYENIHSAKFFNALMFTGDEPAFTYGVMNQYPIVYHLKSEVKHYFRFYIPPTNPVFTAIYENQKDLRDYVHKATELETIFGTSIGNYTTLFNTTIPNELNKTIKITGAMASTVANRAEMLGEVFKGVLVNNILSIKDIFENILIFEAVKGRLNADTQLYINQINVKLATLSTINSTNLNDATVLDNFNTIKREINAIFTELYSKITAAETKLSDVRDIIPHKFKGNTKAQDFQFYTLFELVANPSQSCFTDDTGSYKLNEIKIIPDMPKTVNLAFKELAKLALNFERGGRRGGGYDFTDKILEDMRDILEKVNCDKTVIDLFEKGSVSLPEYSAVHPTAGASGLNNYLENYKTITNKFTPEARQARIAAVPQTGGRRENMIMHQQSGPAVNFVSMKSVRNKTHRNRNRNRSQNSSRASQKVILYPKLNIANKNNEDPTGVFINTDPEAPTEIQQENTPSKINLEFYQSLFEDIKSNVGELEPFGLTAEEYAASIVYRCAIVDHLYPFLHTEERSTPEPDVNLDPSSKIVQMGGALDASEKEILLYIYNDVLIPFWKRYFSTETGQNFERAFLDRVYDGSFIPDYIDVLDEIMGINTDSFISSGDKDLVNTAIYNAKTARDQLIKLANEPATTHRIRYIRRVGGTRTNVGAVLNKPKDAIASDDLNKLPDITSFFSNMFTTTNGTETHDKNLRNTKETTMFFTEEKINDIFCNGPSSPYNETDYTNALQDNLHFHFQSYLDLLYKKAAAAPAGGSRKTRRRARATKQRKSKRRVPRRKRNNK